MYGAIKENLQKELKEIEDAGLYKKERIITTSQDVIIKVSTGEEVINFCANNYLGLSNNIQVVQAAKEGRLKEMFGAGTAAVISPISGFGYQETEYELPEISNSYADLLKKKIVIITEFTDNSLMAIANKYQAEIIEHKEFISGRYSVLSETGMFPAALMGLNLIKFKNLKN